MNDDAVDASTTLNATDCEHHRHLDGAVLKTMPCFVLEAGESDVFDDLGQTGIHPETGKPMPIITLDDGSHAHYVETRGVAVYRMGGA